MPNDVFRPDDLLALGDYVADRWTAGADRDWSARAGTLEWTCTATADHAVDTVFAPAAFLASRRTDRYPDMGIYSVGADATPIQFVEALGVMCRLVVDVVNGADPDVEAVLFGGRNVVTGRPADFVPRAGLELILHAHDVCAGLQVDFEPDSGLCTRLRDHTAWWAMWTIGWDGLQRSDDPWGDLLAASGRART